MIDNFKFTLECAGAALLACVLYLPLLYANIRLAPRLRLIDWPKARGMTEKHVPIVGYSLVVYSIGALIVLNLLFQGSPWLALTSSMMAIMGHLDDRRPVPALDKLFFQSVCIGTLLFLDPQVHAAVTLNFGWVGMFFAGIFMLGLVNAVNFIDGINGLGGIVIVCGALGYVLLGASYDQSYAYLIFASMILGIMCPFLYLNVKKQGGFLGNVGSYFFSFVLLGMHLSIPIESRTFATHLSMTSLCFLIPLADFLVVISTRLYSGRSPFQADKGHLHHRMIQSSLSIWWVLGGFSLIETSATVVSYLISRHSVYTDGVLPIYVCGGYLSITSVLILMIEMASRRRIMDYFERMNTGDPVYFLKYRLCRRDGSPVPWWRVRRVEAKICAEIRVSDICFAQRPNTLIVTLKTMHEPVKGITGRLDGIFQHEKVELVTLEEQGEYVKIAHPTVAPVRKIG